LQKFYEPGGYASAWLQGNAPTPQALVMIERFRSASSNGLEPEDYDASRWDDRMQALKGPSSDPAAFDVALSVCTMRYVSDLHRGRINPQHFNFSLDVNHKKYDLAHFVRDSLLTAPDIPALLDTVEPPFSGYRRTEKALARYVELARGDDGEKLPVPAKAIEVGRQYAGLLRLSRLLRLIGDLPSDARSGDSQIYDATVAEAVKRFQRRHGLDADGRLGPATVKQLNVPLSERVRELQLTLERWRWLPSQFSAPPIIVNLPDFRLRALDDKNEVSLDMRVVVGGALRTQTPVFTR
jgi:L,D-transpeptidase YcbB